MQEPSLITPGFSEAEVKAIVRELRHTPEAFALFFAPESEEMLHRRSEGGWSAVEVVGRLADHDAFERSRRFNAVLTEENPTLPDDNTRFGVDEANYQALFAAETLDFFMREWNLVVTLLESLGPHDWMRTGIHPRDGERTLLQLGGSTRP